MSSSYKTAFLGLNKFIGTDKPRMEDFNFDNNRLDSKLKEHFESSGHVTEAERASWGKASCLIGTYTGDGQTWKKITLGSNPDFGIVFANDCPLVEYIGVSGQSDQYAGMLTQSGKTLGIRPADKGFEVMTTNVTTPDGRRPKLNVSGKEYTYVMFL